MSAPSFRHRDDFTKAYQVLHRRRWSWWEPFSQEGLLVKSIVGAFALYMGLVVVNWLNVPVLTLLYTILVVGIGWYGLDLLRRQVTAHRRAVGQEQEQLLAAAQRFLIEAHLKGLGANGQLAGQRRLDVAKSLLPYIWGVSPEQWRQHPYFEWEGVSVARLSIEQEGKPALQYWLLGAPVRLPLAAESTAFLPQPFAHDRWSQVRHNTAIESPAFRAAYRIYTSNFWHSYYVARAPLVRRFLAQAQDQPAYLVVRKGWLYWAMPQTDYGVAASLAEWERLDAQVGQQVGHGYALAQQVVQMLQHLSGPNGTERHH